MAPCLSKFPSPCLEGIFKHLPLVDLFYSVGLVCTSWYMSRRTELMRRRHLRLITRKDYKFLERQRVRECSYGTELIERVRRDDGAPWHSLESLEHIKFNCLCVPDGMHTIPFSSSLMNMSNITRLNLNLPCTTSNVTQVIPLLDHLSERLVDLTLKIYFHRDRANANNDTANREHTLNVANVVDCLNRSRSIRHLNLGLSELTSHPPLLSCLSRLTTFAFDVDHVHPNSIHGWIYSSVKQYAQNITSIDTYNQLYLHSMLKFDAQLASKFKNLSVIYMANEDFDENQAVSLFCTRFSSLTKLKLLMAVPLPMTKLARCLSLLTQLVDLDLCFGHIPPIERVQPEEGDQAEQVQLQITQIPSVRLLTIHLMYFSSHHSSERLFIPEIFPHLQVLRWEPSDVHVCPECEINPRVDDSDDSYDSYDSDDEDDEGDQDDRARRIAECNRLTLQPFRQCLHLHTVALVHVNKETLIELDDL